MLGSSKSKLLALGWGTALGAFTFLALTDFAIVKNAMWCGDADDHCLRDWIGALSGWAGAVAAAIALFALYDQLAEQRKQTAFSVGDALPTITVIQDVEDIELVVIRVVNWNRRSLLFENLQIEGIDAKWVATQAEVYRQDGRSVGMMSKTLTMVYLRGWEDRSRSPEVFQMKIAAEGDAKLITNWPEAAHVSIKVVLIAETHQRLTLKGHLLGHSRFG